MMPMSIDVTIITGMSGAGRSEAAHVLEDLGYFVIDNLPPALIANVRELARGKKEPQRFAVPLPSFTCALADRERWWTQGNSPPTLRVSSLPCWRTGIVWPSPQEPVAGGPKRSKRWTTCW